MLDNSVEAAEVITFRTETHIKKGQKYEKKVPVSLWPEGSESTQRPHDNSGQNEDDYVQNDTEMMPDAEPRVTSKPHKVRIEKA